MEEKKVHFSKLHENTLQQVNSAGMSGSFM